MGVTASGEQAQYCYNSQCREEGHSFIYQPLSPSPCSLLSSRNYNLKICTKPPLPLFLSLMPRCHSLPLEPHGPCILSFRLGTNHVPPTRATVGSLATDSKWFIQVRGGGQCQPSLMCSRLQATGSYRDGSKYRAALPQFHKHKHQEKNKKQQQ